ncbi:FAD-dependent oxidoreductase [bacterium]|nr:FAD-dependent oxidoreductase [bacterium]
MSHRAFETDCLVIGSGIAGLSTALKLAESGHSVAVLSAAPTMVESNTVYAQGGIILEAAQRNADSLVEDILEAGGRINYLPAVQQLATLGPQLVRDVLIDKARVAFDASDDEGLHLTREGGHSEPRIIHRADETGRSIEESLFAYCKTNPRIRFLPQTTAVNLLMTSHHGLDRTLIHEPARCFGAFVFDQTAGEVYAIQAAHTVLATGGLGQLFLHNTNSRFARGDGIALADRAGCRLESLEYIQFHPTTFFKAGCPRFLVSEALRGEGAVLVNALGERFLSKYLPQYPIPELGPRDKVSQAIHQEMLSTGASCVFLDISHKPSEWVRERFPFVYRNCRRYGIDVTVEPIPVVPGAHYSCGGVWVDLEGRTTVRNLWATGEVSCTGLHGANRLASTSLLEGLVWGHRAALAISAGLEKDRPRFPSIEPWELGTAHVDPSFLSQDWLTLKHTMWNYVGLIKTESRLSRADGILRELARGIETFYRRAQLSDALIGLRHASLVAIRVLEASIANPKSLGCYHRGDLEI